MAEPDRTEILPAHIEGTVAAIARLHDEQRKRATPFQKSIEGLTGRVGRPSFIAWLAVIAVGWIVFNLAMMVAGRAAWEEPPFAWLEMAVSLAAPYVTVMILTTRTLHDRTFF